MVFESPNPAESFIGVETIVIWQINLHISHVCIQALIIHKRIIKANIIQMFGVHVFSHLHETDLSTWSQITTSKLH